MTTNDEIMATIRDLRHELREDLGEMRKRIAANHTEITRLTAIHPAKEVEDLDTRVAVIETWQSRVIGYVAGAAASGGIAATGASKLLEAIGLL